MPGGRRTDRISEKDLAVLEFIARYGVVPREVVADWAGTARAVTASRERRLRIAGLIEVGNGFGRSGRLLVATRRGLAAIGREELRVARPSAAAVRHEEAVARVGVLLEVRGYRVLSERELQATERVEGKRIYSVRSGERWHRPDLVLLRERPEAIEVELTPKAPRRLDVIIRGWRRALAQGRYERVRYLCAPVTERLLERALAGIDVGGQIVVQPLPVALPVVQRFPSAENATKHQVTSPKGRT